MWRVAISCALAVLTGMGVAHATMIPFRPVEARKLLIVDRLVSSARGKVVFVAQSRGVTKGDGTDPEQISVDVSIVYGNGSTAGAFTVPAGTANGWIVSNSRVAKFANRNAPEAPTQVKALKISERKKLKVVAKGVGDVPIDIVTAGSPTAPLFTSYCVNNGGELTCQCSGFVGAGGSGCVHKAIGDGTGAKLQCKFGVRDPRCHALCSDAPVDLGLTVLDPCTNLEWEKKDTSLASGADVANPHDVDNRYAWAGRCSLDQGIPCQPTSAAAALCAAQTGGHAACDECGAGTGTCELESPFALGTVWEWLAQINASSFAGHDDWRLPTTHGVPGESIPGDEPELESIGDIAHGVCSGGVGACIDPTFGPTWDRDYWTGSTGGFCCQFYLWAVLFDGPAPGSHRVVDGDVVSYVRAVRSGP